MIKDLQIMYSKDGKPAIADPLGTRTGKLSDPNAVKTTRNLLKQNIQMVQEIILKK